MGKKGFISCAWILVGILLPNFVARKVFIQHQMCYNGPSFHQCTWTLWCCVGEHMGNPWIGCIKLRSKDYTGQWMDCPNLNFAHNIYIYITSSVTKSPCSVLDAMWLLMLSACHSFVLILKVMCNCVASHVACWVWLQWFPKKLADVHWNCCCCQCSFLCLFDGKSENEEWESWPSGRTH